MADQSRSGRYPLPSTQAWDRFCDEVDVAAQMLAEQRPAQPPLERLSSEQYACGKFFAACHALLIALSAPPAIRELAALPAQAWQHAAWGIPDPLFAVVPLGSGRRAASLKTTAFRAMIVKLADELASGDGAVPWRQAAQAASQALHKAQAPKGYKPSAKSIQNWLAEATDPKTPTEQHLAEAYAYYRHRPWPETAGVTLAERVRWVVAIHSAHVP
jgi:hypothetical protein